MKKSTTVVIVTSVLSGAMCGLLWMRFGDHVIEPVFGQPVTWFVLPPIVSVVCSLICFFAGSRQEISHRVANTLVFALVFYLSFWAPLVCLIGALFLTGETM